MPLTHLSREQTYERLPARGEIGPKRRQGLRFGVAMRPVNFCSRTHPSKVFLIMVAVLRLSGPFAGHPSRARYIAIG